MDGSGPARRYVATLSFMKKEKLYVCPICGGRDLSLHPYCTDQMNLSSCGECAAIFQNPRVAEAQYDDVNLSSQELKNKGTFYGNYEGAPDVGRIKNYYRVFLDELDRETGHKDAAKRLLDVGCATGLLMSIGKELEFETYGLDVSGFAAKRAKEFGQVFVGTVEEYHPSQKFDIITCISALEHLPHPLDSIRRMISFLNEHGVLGIEIPVNELKRICIQRHFIDCNAKIPNGHLFQFNQTNVRNMLLYLDDVDISLSYYGIISDKDCRHAYVRKNVLRKPSIRLALSVLERLPSVEKLLQLEFFGRIKISKVQQ